MLKLIILKKTPSTPCVLIATPLSFVTHLCPSIFMGWCVMRDWWRASHGRIWSYRLSNVYPNNTTVPHRKGCFACSTFCCEGQSIVRQLWENLHLYAYPLLIGREKIKWRRNFCSSSSPIGHFGSNLFLVLSLCWASKQCCAQEFLRFLCCSSSCG